MKIHCDCGTVLHDSDRNRKGHVIPDQVFDDLLDEIDRAIEATPRPLRSKEGACMRIRTLINKVTRSAWQCSGCGRLYIDGASGALVPFDPPDKQEAAGILQDPERP